MYYEVVEVSHEKPYVKTYTFTDIREAASVARYLAWKSGRETLLRKVTDLAYLSADSLDMLTGEWRVNYAITQVYKDEIY